MSSSQRLGLGSSLGKCPEAIQELRRVLDLEADSNCKKCLIEVIVDLAEIDSFNPKLIQLFRNNQIKKNKLNKVLNKFCALTQELKNALFVRNNLITLMHLL